jgi:UDP-2,3-diacylglucosamine hydrolase
MTTLFISDLHLDTGQTALWDQCLDFLRTEASQADALYILGDLFEAWVGDDDSGAEKHRVINALHVLTRDRQVPCYFMRGNRDFLAGDVFAAHSGCTLLDDPTVVEIYGQPVLLMHGDTLCTDDVDYQEFRALVRDPMWQQNFLAMSLEHRQAMARKARDASRTQTAGKSNEIMDVNQESVVEAMKTHKVRTLIHGHTHRPGIHEFQIGNTKVRRIVLGDWRERGSVLRWSTVGLGLATLPR